jgi:hypothetical protein
MFPFSYIKMTELKKRKDSNKLPHRTINIQKETRTTQRKN